MARKMASMIMIALLSCFSSIVSAQTSKAVYAHFMLGIVENFTVADWKIDIQQAKDIGIDGFVLNCAPTRVDSYTPKQLKNAYDAAAQLNFKIFISFDFAYWNDGDRAEIISLLNTYGTHSAQAFYNQGALVSTFVGDYFNWDNVKNALPGKKLTVIPNIQDPNSFGNRKDIEGAFSWYAWPTDGGNSVIPGPMTLFWKHPYT